LTVVLKKITYDINFTDNKSHQGAKFGTVGRSCFTERLKHIIKCSSLFVGTIGGHKNLGQTSQLYKVKNQKYTLGKFGFLQTRL
jgi:hypothetical protein